MKVVIGSMFTPPPSAFSRRDAHGGFAHSAPPMSRTDELLQQALLAPALDDDRVSHRGDRWVGLVCYAGLAGVALAYAVAQVTA